MGAVWIYTRTGGVWSQQGSKLVGIDATGAAYLGYSASISADGNTAIVGGYSDNSNAGAGWIFTRTGGVWSQQGDKLVGTGATGAARKGISVSLSSDGNTAIVGGYNDNSNAGAAWVFLYTISTDATVTSGIYTVSTEGGGAETITNVPYGTSKATFESNLTMGDENQTWDDSGIHDPVVTGDTLVVTAQDGETTITYTITTIAPSTNATVTSEDYTVSTVGGGDETITNVPYGTSQTDFLANLTMGDENQTWDYGDVGSLNNPVRTGDTLVVTAEDGTTIITYTVTTDAELSHDATVTSGIYTVGTSGGVSRTITDVPYGTANEDFWDNLTKGQADQTWDGSGLSDPIVTGDTLVVTAQDGTTVITYTVTVLPDAGVDISTCSEFEDINNDLTRSYRLTADLDCTSEGNNIMINDDPFSGSLDGQGHTITIAINAITSDYVGLFVEANGADISNLNIAGVVHGGYNENSYVGALVGYGTNLDIENVTSTATVSGYDYVGGLIGYLTTDVGTATVNESSSTGNISGIEYYVGGLIGYTDAGAGDINITDSHSSGFIDGYSYVGGLIGEANNYSGSITTISGSYSTSTMVGYNSYAGGLVGYIDNQGNSEEGDTTAVNVTNSYHTTGNVSSTNSGEVGGLIGYAYTDYTATLNVTNSYAVGTVSGYGFTGGLIGQLQLGDGGDSVTANILRNHFSGSVSSSSSNNNVGGLIGYLSYSPSSNTFISNVTISNNYTTGTVSGDSNVGGLVGESYVSNSGDYGLELTIDSNHSTSSITGIGGNTGGLVGHLQLDSETEEPFTFTFNQNYASGAITNTQGNSYIGGLIGSLSSYDDYGDQLTGTLSGNYFTGTVTNDSASSYTGGLVGYAYVNGDNVFDISDSYTTNSVTGVGNYVGGLIGSTFKVSISNSYSLGDITGLWAVGGLVGVNAYSTISESFAKGNVLGTGKWVGGLVGGNTANSTIENAYAEGTVTGDTGVGGLAGLNVGTITNTYANGVVTGNTNVGGLVGLGSTGHNTGTVTSSYYDELTGQTDTDKGTLTTTALMKTQSNYQPGEDDWNFDPETGIWGIDTTLARNDGYPYLQWEEAPIVTHTLTYTAGAHGSITGDLSQTVNDGENGTAVTAVPSSGYHFVKWSDNNSTVASRTDTNVTADITTTASFEQDASSGGGGGGGGVPVPPPTDCKSGEQFSTTTGLACSSFTPTVCPVGQLYSTTTGQPCSSWTNPSTSSGPSAYNFGPNTLKLGSHNDYVKDLQKFLNAQLNLHLTLDGQFGKATMAAVKQWQKAHNLTPDGKVGPKTKEKMYGVV